MKRTDPVKEILQVNRTLDPRRVRLKYEGMRGSVFTFLRATCPLFYLDLPSDPVLEKAPLSWISGDLHLENFGSYKGDNRLGYFDMNDFDEACLAPSSLEILRFLSSLLLASEELEIGEPEALGLCRHVLDAYLTQLKTGKPRWIERPLAKGLIRQLLKTVRNIDRPRFLETRTTLRGKKRTLRVDGKKALPTSAREREQVMEVLERFAAEQPHPEFFRVLDIADRISGMGSLGVRRHVVLVEGRGSPDGNFLIDLKEARPSSLAPRLPFPQPPWPDEAGRVVGLQRLSQSISPALLTSLRMADRSFILKELQPSEHRVNLAAWNGRIRRLETVIASMGSLAAWGQLRGSGWRGSAPREELALWAGEERLVPALVDLAVQRNRRVVRHWKEFCRAYDAGAFGDPASS